MSGDDISGRPWARRPKESAKAYKAFVTYLELGAGRSITKAFRKIGNKSGQARHFEKWSSQYEWVSRARAYDSDLMQDRIQGRKLQQEQGRQLAIDETPEMMQELRELSRGYIRPGQQRVKLNRDGKPITYPVRDDDGEPVLDDDGEPVVAPVVEEMVNPKVRAMILKDLLAIGGVMAPVRTEITGADGVPLGLDEAIQSWDPEILAAMIKAAGLDL